MDNLFSDSFADNLVIDIRECLSRDKDVVYTDNLKFTIIFLLVLKNDLSLAIGAQPWDSTRVPLISELFAQFVCEPMRVGVKALFVPLVGSVAEHEALITSSGVFTSVSISND